MIDGKIKQKLLDEIQKFGNVYLSCLRAGVSKATYYRWKQKNKRFKEEADEAERIGRENISDVAEHALLQNLRKGNQRAIEFALMHNSLRYRPKTVQINHTSGDDVARKEELEKRYQAGYIDGQGDELRRIMEPLSRENIERLEKQGMPRDMFSATDNSDLTSETDTSPEAQPPNQSSSSSSDLNFSNQSSLPDNST